MTHPDYRALCAELLAALDRQAASDPEADGGLLRHRARAALAQPEPACVACDGSPAPENSPCAVCGAVWAKPEPVGATDEELKAAYWEAFVDAASCGADESWLSGLRAVARWGRPAITPIPVSERPWEREGFCDAEGRCWLSAHAVGGHFWHLWPQQKWLPGTGYCLPHWALPIPHQNPESK